MRMGGCSGITFRDASEWKALLPKHESGKAEWRLMVSGHFLRVCPFVCWGVGVGWGSFLGRRYRRWTYVRPQAIRRWQEHRRFRQRLGLGRRAIKSRADIRSFTVNRLDTRRRSGIGCAGIAMVKRGRQVREWNEAVCKVFVGG